MRARGNHISLRLLQRDFGFGRAPKIGGVRVHRHLRTTFEDERAYMRKIAQSGRYFAEGFVAAAELIARIRYCRAHFSHINEAAERI